ncbi:hypothetical protein GCM10008164_51070 [Achromobacter xylosoxidans]|nr:hypothetical protein GCM10008164_51070 [Achromobacter xylosoxidans]
MRPRESEGVAEGGDEDDEGGVRSERSGPQSRARAASRPAPPGAYEDNTGTNKNNKNNIKEPPPAPPPTPAAS